MGARAVIAVTIVAGFATACSAIIAGQLSDTNDLPKKDGGPSSSAPGEVDKCALIDKPDASNECSECIETNCAAEVEIACARDASSREPWFSSLQNCAKGPDQRDSYQCSQYDRLDGGAIRGDSSAARKYESELCVKSKCLNGPTPPCKQCNVKVETGTGSTTQRLVDDNCGKCVAENCEAVLVRCCQKQPISDFVTACAFTDKETNRETCRSLAGQTADAAPSRYDVEDKQCLEDLATCFKSNCVNVAACQ